MDMFAHSGPQGRQTERGPMQVSPPAAHAGIGAALRQSYQMPAVNEEFARLLAQLR